MLYRHKAIIIDMHICLLAELNGVLSTLQHGTVFFQHGSLLVDFAKLIKSSYVTSFDEQAFLLFCLSYYYRCNYFHDNMSILLVGFASDVKIKAIEIMNYYIDQFIEQKHMWFFEHEK